MCQELIQRKSKIGELKGLVRILLMHLCHVYSYRSVGKLSPYLGANSLLTVVLHHLFPFCSSPPPSCASFPSGLVPSPAQSLCADYHWMSSHTMRSLIRH